MQDAQWIPEPPELLHFRKRTRIEYMRSTRHLLHLSQTRYECRALLQEGGVTMEMLISPYLLLAVLVVVLQPEFKFILFNLKSRFEERPIRPRLEFQWLLVTFRFLEITNNDPRRSEPLIQTRNFRKTDTVGVFDFCHQN